MTVFVFVQTVREKHHDSSSFWVIDRQEFWSTALNKSAECKQLEKGSVTVHAVQYLGQQEAKSVTSTHWLGCMPLICTCLAIKVKLVAMEAGRHSFMHVWREDLYNRRNIKVGPQDLCHHFSIWLNVKYGNNLPFFSWVMEFNNGLKKCFCSAQRGSGAFDILHMKYHLL